MQRDPITIDEELCTLCGQCVEVCIIAKLLESGEEVINIVKPELCSLCGHCVAICPVDAITVGEDEPMPLPKGKAVTPEQMMVHLRTRRSIRHYEEEPVPRELIERVIEAGRFAPTGGNLQSIYFTIVTDPNKIDVVRKKVLTYTEDYIEAQEALAKEQEIKGTLSDEQRKRMTVFITIRSMVERYKKGQDTIFYGAPVVILLHGEPENIRNKDNADLMAMCCLLMAESLGLGTCIIGLLTTAAANDETLRELIGLPKGHQVFTSMVMGYPTLEFNKAPGRRPVKANWI